MPEPREPTEPAESPPPALERVPAMACGVRGCLVGATVLFVVLLIAILYVWVLRVQTPPTGTGLF
jgi:hypothetical protein